MPIAFDDSYHYQPPQQDNEQSVSPVNESDRWRPPTSQEGNPPPFFPSPNPEPAVLSRPAGEQQRWTMSNAPAQDWSQQVQAAVDNAQVAATQPPPMQQKSRPPLVHDQGNSFYWHSDQSTAPASRATSSNAKATSVQARPPTSQPQAPSALEEVYRKDSEVLSGMPSLANSPMPSYGASALGFGGPSDWEHFGDYDAEDIDDTDLYTKVKEPTVDKVPELPADTMSKVQHLPSGAPPKHEPVPASFRPPSPPKPNHNTNDSIMIESSPPIANGTAQDTAFNGTMSGKAQDPEAIPPDSEWQTADRRGKRHDTGAVSAEPHRARESEISISDFPLPNSQKPAPTVDAEASVGATESSSHNASGANFEHIIEAWTKPHSSGQHSVRQEVEEDEAEKPKALNISPKPKRSTATFASVDQPENNQQTQNLNNDSSRGDPDVRSAQDKPEALDSSLSDNQENDGPYSSQDNSKGDRVAEKVTKATEGKLDIPSGSAAKRPSSSRRNSVIDVRSSDHTFDDLDPWAVASLNRYVAMLREESKAQTNEAKLKIFTVFTTRETRLRSVLYEAEEKKEEEESQLAKAVSVRRSNTTSSKHESKALPALPPNASQQIGAEAFTLSRAGSKMEKSNASKQEHPPKLKSVSLTDADINLDDKEELQDVQYSPGGRPLVARPRRVSVPSESASTQAEAEKKGNATGASDEPAYKPFKYEKGRSEVKAYAANRLSKRNSQYRPYAQLTSEPEPPIPVDGDMLAKQKEAQDDVVHTTSKDKVKERPLPPSLVTAPQSKFRVNGIPDPSISSDSPTSRPPDDITTDLRRFVNADFDPLTAVLPQDEVRNETPAQLLDLQNIINLVPDEFSFIHASFVAWDSNARGRRDTNERERHIRQVESEQRIDALFDDHDIGYGDISELEAEFKRNEAARKADEDRAEYQTFVTEVFDVVWTRLHFEIDQLGPHYKRFTELLDSTTAGQDIFTEKPDNLPLAPTMDALLTLHQKLEIRHQKALTAVLERDRRQKKTEIAPWYNLGNVAKVKDLERQFETAEKQAIVDYCSQCDARANSLMDVIDRNTLRGVGTNQDYMEMIMKAVRRIASGRAFASTPGDTQPEVGLPEVHKAQAVTKALTISSEQIVQTFHVADMLLNAADYEVSVAKSRQAGADRASFERLKEERAKEDQKLMKDLQHRLALIREDSRKTHDEIVKLLVFLGAQGGNLGNQSATKPLPDPSHQERLQKALEEAKRRNERANGVG